MCKATKALAMLAAVLLAGCAPTVKVIRPVSVAGTGVTLPVSSLAFVPADLFTKECKEALDAGEVPATAMADLSKHLGAFHAALGQSLAAGGFALSPKPDGVYVKLQIAQSGLGSDIYYGSRDGPYAVESSVQAFPPLDAWETFIRSESPSMRSGQPGPAFLGLYTGVHSLIFRLEYLDAKDRTLGVVQHEWHTADSLEQAARTVAEFTRTAFGNKKGN